VNLKDWVAPAVAVAIVGVGITYLESRLASFDRRFDTLAAEMAGQRDRADRIIENIGSLRAELAAVALKVDGIATKLDVASIPSEAPWAGSNEPPAAGPPWDGEPHAVPTDNPKDSPAGQGFEYLTP
jgi:hypothetical protein